MSQLDQLDYYTLLAIEDTATERDVKKAFRQFAKKYHPDRYAGAAPDKIERATKIYRRGSEAYQILTEPAARKAYDEALAAGKLRITAEERDRAIAQENADPVKKQPIQSPQAWAFFKKAVEASKKKNWKAAFKALKMAREIEPNNDFIEARFQKVAKILRSP